MAKRYIPLISVILFLTSCSSVFESEDAAEKACLAWKEKGGIYSISLIMPSYVNQSNTSYEILSALGDKYGIFPSQAENRLYESFGFGVDGYPGKFFRQYHTRGCINNMNDAIGVDDDYSFTGFENKHYKSGQVITVDAKDYAEIVRGTYRFKTKNMKKFANEIYKLMEKNSDYKDVMKFKF